jgi:hypothetical protein
MAADARRDRRMTSGSAARAGRSLGLAAAVGASMAACHRADVTTSGTEALAAKADAEASLAPSVVVAARCRSGDGGVAIAEADSAELEIDDVVATGDGLVAGAVHRTPAGRVAAVLRWGGTGEGGAAEGRPRWLDLAPTLGDAPPAKVVAHAGAGGADVVAAAYLLPGGSGDAGPGAHRDGARSLALFAVGPAQTSSPGPLLVVPQQHDDSLAFDVAFAGPSGVVVWDEGAAPSRGVIRAVALDDAGARASSLDASGGAHDISPSESDAELPRLVADGAGFVALWIARRPEPGRIPDASEPEAMGEPRSFGWLESVRLDARGAAAGPVRALTPATGHVSAYDVASVGAPERTILVVARDDGESVDGSGGVLVRVRIVAGAAEPPVELLGDGLGRGAPVLVDGAAPFLAWVGPGEQGRLLALDRAGAPLGPPSAEDLLSDARPLRVLDGSPGSGPAGLLVAAASGASATLRTMICTR